MSKFLTKLTSILTISTFVITTLAVVPVIAEDDATVIEVEETLTAVGILTDEELKADNVFAPTNSDTVEFTLDVRWGYVRGNQDKEKTEKNYDGSIIVGNTNEGKVGLIKKLLFENHDSINSERNPISWSSKIFGHWDGVRVHVLAKGEADIVITAGDFTIQKTAREWFALGSPAIDQTDDGQMLVVKVNKKKHRRHGVLVWWGIKNRVICNDTFGPEDISPVCALPQTIDFSGNLTMDTDALIKLKRKLRFEDNDSIDEHDRNHIAWTSSIVNDRDGIYSLMLPKRDVLITSGFTVTFNKINGGWSKHYTFEDVKNGIREIIEIDGVDYVLLIGRKHIVKQLIKARTSRRLYLIEDDIKHEVDSNDVLAANGLKEDEAVLMDDDELQAYEEGDELNYPDGSVVEDGNNTYVIENGQKRRLATRDVINRFTDAKRLFSRLVSAVRLNRFSTGALVTDEDEITDESLIKVERDTAVWRVRGNKRQVFTHLRIFNLHKLNFDRVRTVTQEKFNQFDRSPPVKYPDGSLVKIPTDPKVYLIKGGLRHWVETEADLRGLGFDFSDIVDMPPTEITNYAEGDPVIADDLN